MKIDGQIESKLKLLRLTGMLQTLAVRLKQAEESDSGYLEFLMTLIEDEYERRQSGSLLKRLKKAGFEAEKTLEGFDIAFNPQIQAKKIKQLASCACIDNKENILILLQGVLGYIDNNLNNDLRIEDLAHIARLSKYHFIRRFKRFTGFTPKKYILFKRIEKAKELIREENISVSDLSSEVGFNYVSNFSKFFKKYTGYTPSTYKKIDSKKSPKYL